VLRHGGEDDVAIGLDATGVEIAVNLREKGKISLTQRRGEEEDDAPAKRQPDPSEKEESDRGRPRVSATNQCTNRSRE